MGFIRCGRMMENNMFNGRLSPKVLVNGLLVLLIVAILLGRKFACLPGMNMDQGDIG
jgi:competence protein ComEC